MTAVVAPAPGAAAAPNPVSLGDGAPLGVFAGTAVSNTDLTAITGDLGVSPGDSVTGFPPGTVSGSIHAGDSAAASARADLIAAYNEVASRTPATSVPSELGGTTKTPGVYSPPGGTFQITGTLTLDAQADPDAVFIFRATTLSTANVSNINLVGGAQANNVFWQLTGSATLGTNCTFRGNVLASNSVTVGTGAAVFGRVFAINGIAVLQGTANPPRTRITVPNDPPTTTTLTTSPNPSRTSQSVTLTATVSPVSGSIVPQGQVAFKDGDTVLGTDNHNSLGPATITISTLTAGEHSLTAVYLGGDTPDNEAIIHFAPSTSPLVTQTVTSSLFSAAATPEDADYPDAQAVTVGVKFQAATSGTIRGIRFYKSPQNSGTHTGSLWSSSGQLLASATYSNETASGWQQVNFANPVTINPDTTYVASYHTPTGNYSITRPYFTTKHTNGPLTALANGPSGGNGVFTYSATNAFPTSGFRATNYWVDVVFTPFESLWSATDTPEVTDHPDGQAVTVGVKFQAATSGAIRGIRFYKSPQNSGTHTGSLWSSSGQLLASATFTNETASGWQQVNFANPVTINPDTTYIASYYSPTGKYSLTRPYFTSKYNNGPLTALASSGNGGNGVYTYSATNAFPTSAFQATNYWVDVVYDGNPVGS
ncbi:hypothetical protein GCM10023194_24320 [Planotetraspora phitsanulokensis]|uniref:DUF4082 domain-containing protein n=2 Tax=Planotetraspora phitsanulokensis TaxID=575192 RepID=A0A8J3UG84_9ACTN|nr:hypothetical protein Pph01_77390 [Planotetraspora phitsanulokensis]